MTDTQLARAAMRGAAMVGYDPRNSITVQGALYARLWKLNQGKRNRK